MKDQARTERFLLNERFVRSLKPPVSADDREFYSDSQMRGFGVRITAAGAISFWQVYTITGRTRRCTVGHWPELSVQIAREEAVRLRQGIRAGTDPLEEKRALRTAPLVSDLAEEYMQEVAEKKKRAGSLRNDRSMLRAIILPRLGHLKVRAVTQRDVEKLHGSLANTPYHANRVLALLSTMYVHAIAWGRADSNPAHGVERYPEDKRETWLTIAELKCLEAALRDYPDQIVADAIRLLIVTGSRRNEVLGATWKEFDLERGTWTKPSHATKQKRTEFVPLSSAALAILFRLRRRALGSPYLFPDGKGGHRIAIRRPWMQVCKVAGLAEAHEVPGKRRMRTLWKPRIRLHDLRHSFASHLISSGQSLYLVGRLLGHSNPATTQRYAHCDDKSLRDVTESFGKKLRLLA
jgi:integrase